MDGKFLKFEFRKWSAYKYIALGRLRFEWWDWSTKPRYEKGPCSYNFFLGHFCLSWFDPSLLRD